MKRLASISGQPVEARASTTRFVRHGARAVALAGAAFAVACVQAPRMCITEPDCGTQGSCVAGRCLRRGAVAAVVTARRWLYAPVDVAFVARGAPGGGNPNGPDPASSPALAALGRGDGARALFRFAIDLPPEATVLEAFLLLRQAADVDADPDPVVLHAARVIEPWEGRSVTWAHQPRVVEVGAPVTRVLPSTGRNVRVDVRAIVQRWRRRSREDFGIALVAEGRSATGVTFALEAVPAALGRGDPVLTPLEPHFAAPLPEHGVRAVDVTGGPELELYVK